LPTFDIDGSGARLNFPVSVSSMDRLDKGCCHHGQKSEEKRNALPMNRIYKKRHVGFSAEAERAANFEGHKKSFPLRRSSGSLSFRPLRRFSMETRTNAVSLFPHCEIS
jgi:hypothetical protein